MMPTTTFDFVSLETRFKNSLCDLVFRRVDTVDLRGPVKVLRWTPFGAYVAEGEDINVNPQTVEAKCENGFSGKTFARGQLEDEYANHPIHFDSSTYAEPDIVQDCSFELKYVHNTIFPHANKGSGMYPDLLCGIVSPGASPKEYVPTGSTPASYHFTKWFICSPQFYTLWMTIMYPDSAEANPPVNKNYPKMNTDFGKRINQYKWLMSGDRLCVNNFHKWVMSNKIDLSNGLNQSPLEMKEIIIRFKRTRSESVAKMWVHTYAALAMMIRFHRMPDNTNVPANINGETMGYWDLPHLFCERMLGIAERDLDEDDDEDVEEYFAIRNGVLCDGF
jgi:hypothetical protein